MACAKFYMRQRYFRQHQLWRVSAIIVTLGLSASSTAFVLSASFLSPRSVCTFVDKLNIWDKARASSLPPLIKKVPSYFQRSIRITSVALSMPYPLSSSFKTKAASTPRFRCSEGTPANPKWRCTEFRPVAAATLGGAQQAYSP